MARICVFCGKELGIFDRNTLLAGVSWSGNLLYLPMSSAQGEVNEQGRSYQIFALLE